MQHITVRTRGTWHHGWCLVVTWLPPWETFETWCACRYWFGFICPFCFANSTHLADARNGYCGVCHVHVDDLLNTIAVDPIGAHQ